MQKRDEGEGGGGGCSRLRFARCLLRWLLRWLFHPGAKGNFHFNYAQFKAENVIRAHALEMRSVKEQEHLKRVSMGLTDRRKTAKNLVENRKN